MSGERAARVCRSRGLGGPVDFALRDKTIWAHSVRCLGVKTLLKEFSDRNPVAFMLDLLAPGTDPQKSLQVEEARYHPPGANQNGDRDHESDACFEAGLPNVGMMRSAE